MVGTTNEPITLGNLVWSSDDKVIYAAQFKSIEEGTECGLCEIPVSGQKLRSTPLWVTKEDELARVSFQIALSPDGKCVAASTGFNVEDTAESRALYLVDLRRAKRPVRKIPVPIPKPVRTGTHIL